MADCCRQSAVLSRQSAVIGRRSQSSVGASRIHAALDENDEALRGLEEAYRVRDGNMVLFNVWSASDPLRDDSRFRDLLQRMKFP